MTSTRQGFITIGSRVDATLAERVRQAAEAEDRSISSFTRRALQREVERVSTARLPERQAA